MSHAILAPSSAKRWWNCPGSVHLIKTLPEQSNTSLYSAQGTAAHYIAALLLKELPDTQALDNMEALDGMWIHVPHAEDKEPFLLTIKEKLDWKGQGQEGDTGFWFEISWEDNDGTVSLEHVNHYVHYVYCESVKYGLLKHQIEIEKKLPLFGLDLDGSPRTGTVDCAFTIPLVKLQVIDLKFGKGVSVDVEGNLQLLDYALGKWDSLSQEERDLIPCIEMTIHQPRRGGLKTVCISPAILEDYRQQLALAIQDTTTDMEDELRAGDWCVDTFCPAKSICPAAAEYKEDSVARFANLLEPTQIVTRDEVVLRKATEMSNEELGFVLERTPYVHSWLETMELEALRRAKNGQVIPGRKLVERDKHRIFPDEEAITTLLHNWDVPANEWFAPRKLKTPNQMELMVKKLVGKDKVANVTALSMKPKGETILVKVDDKRPAISVATSEQNFGNLITDVEVVNGND